MSNFATEQKKNSDCHGELADSPNEGKKIIFLLPLIALSWWQHQQRASKSLAHTHRRGCAVAVHTVGIILIDCALLQTYSRLLRAWSPVCPFRMWYVVCLLIRPETAKTHYTDGPRDSSAFIFDSTTSCTLLCPNILAERFSSRKHEKKMWKHCRRTDANLWLVYESPAYMCLRVCVSKCV